MSTNDVRRTLDTLRVVRAVGDSTRAIENTISIWYSMQLCMLLVVLARLENDLTWQLVYIGIAVVAMLSSLHSMWTRWRGR